jgi:hypothetical protein
MAPVPSAAAAAAADAAAAAADAAAAAEDAAAAVASTTAAVEGHGTAAVASVSSGQQALNGVVTKFGAVDPADLRAGALLDAARELSKLYGLLWPEGGRVHDLLLGDLVSHIDGLQRAVDEDQRLTTVAAAAVVAAAAPGEALPVYEPAAADVGVTDSGAAGDPPLWPLLEREVGRRGVDAVRADLGSGVCSSLWLGRTLAFLVRFMAHMGAQPQQPQPDAAAAGDASVRDGGDPADPPPPPPTPRLAVEPYTAARAAYADTLAPYHGVLMGWVVRLVLGSLGHRQSLCAAFGMPSQGVMASYAARVAAAMAPVADALLGGLAGRGWDFPDVLSMPGL